MAILHKKHMTHSYICNANANYAYKLLQVYPQIYRTLSATCEESNSVCRLFINSMNFISLPNGLGDYQPSVFWLYAGQGKIYYYLFLSVLS